MASTARCLRRAIPFHYVCPDARLFSVLLDTLEVREDRPPLLRRGAALEQPVAVLTPALFSEADLELLALRAPQRAPRASLATEGCRVKALTLVVALTISPACGSRSHGRAPRVQPKYESEVAAAVEDVKATYPVPPALVLAVIQQESSFRPQALSPVGARGLMQVMPANARRLGVTPAELRDPAKNILAGTRLLATLLAHYRGDVISALVAYNARPRPRFAPLPRNGETPAYVWSVLAFYEQYRCAEAHDCERKAPVAALDPIRSSPK